jgi:hypothetical protein
MNKPLQTLQTYGAAAQAHLPATLLRKTQLSEALLPAARLPEALLPKVLRVRTSV